MSRVLKNQTYEPPVLSSSQYWFSTTCSFSSMQYAVSSSPQPVKAAARGGANSAERHGLRFLHSVPPFFVTLPERLLDARVRDYGLERLHLGDQVVEVVVQLRGFLVLADAGLAITSANDR